MYSLFNGTTDVITDNNGRVVNLDNNLFRRNPGQQYELVASAQPFWPAYGPSLEEKGYNQLAPNLIMDTNKVNQIKTFLKGCLLYTSDAADERSSVDLGGRRIIKKKITKEQS